MRKFYFLFSLLAICMTSLAAKADDDVVHLNFSVPGNDMVYIQYYDNETYSSIKVNLQEGDNAMEFASGDYVYVRPLDGYTLGGLTCDGESVGSKSSYGDYYTLSVTSDLDGKSITVAVNSLADLRTATCHFKVDNPDKIKLKRSSGTTLTVPEAGEYFDVAFIPDSENQFTISTVDYDTPLYKVLQNGEEVATSTYVYLTVADGDYIDIYADYPDIDCNVTFSYKEGAEGFLTKVTVNGEEVADFSNGFTCKVGDKVMLYGDIYTYQYNEITINGEAISYFYGTTQFIAKGDTQIVVDAEKYPTLTCTVNVDNPERVKLILDYDYDNPIPLVAGDNTIEFTEMNDTFLFQPAGDNYYLTSVNDGSTEYLYSSSTYAYVYASDGMTITVTSGEVIVDKQFCIYFDDLSAAEWGYYLNTSKRNTVEVNNGYNIIDFDTSYSPYYFQAYGLDDDFYYDVDGTYKTVSYGSCSFPVQDKSVVKFFLLGEPATNTINVTYPTSGVQEVKIDKDYFTEIESGAESFATLGETLVRVYVTAEEGVTPAVLFNNEAIELNAESGAYEFTATEAGDLVISAEGSGISILGAAKANNNVYSIDGVMIYRNASQEQISTLPAGLYIINNKKVVVRK
jgi:hypothetical protein